MRTWTARSTTACNPPGPVDSAVHYVHQHLRRTHAALRTAHDCAQREHGLTALQYACLHALGTHPGQSTAGLARATLVTRQSIHVSCEACKTRA
ncbi:helix-turn-helix domain-containing protein [Streptomyces californicus]|uniref:helix-turn-helix domain-containing protein n=1 Tax=Streptomyces californicus TaxID=67351 RepID=UPI0033EA0265